LLSSLLFQPSTSIPTPATEPVLPAPKTAMSLKLLELSLPPLPPSPSPPPPKAILPLLVLQFQINYAGFMYVNLLYEKDNKHMKDFQKVLHPYVHVQ
jgi:hypothetical protein